MIWIRIGALSALIAVIAGSFGAHGLKDHFESLYKDTEVKPIVGGTIPAAQKYLKDFHTGAEYQMTHSLALIAVGLLSLFVGTKRKSLTIAGASFTLGILLFSGCLYLLALFNLPKLGMIVPIGGTLFLIGWASFAVATFGSVVSLRDISKV